MLDLIRLALRYLLFNRGKTAILVLAIALILFLPFALHLLVKSGSESLLNRAQATPLVIGSKASPLELVLNTLYFESDEPPPIAYGELDRVNRTGWANAIPIYNRFSAQGIPIVGTNIDYAEFRGLHFASGRNVTLIGECILGAAAAQELGLRVGDSVFSSPEEVFDLAGVYPLKMPVVGILKPTGGPDDHVVLTDVKTTWVIAGYGHGHEDLSQTELQDSILHQEGANIVASSAVVTYNEITDANRSSYHFHADVNQLPLTAVIALPKDHKGATLLRGSFLDPYETVQIIQPQEVIDDLLKTIFTVQNYLMIGATLAVGSMLMTAALVFLLSIRLRKREIETMQRIGISKSRIRSMLALEIGLVFSFGILFASLLAWTFSSYVDLFVRSLVTVI